MPSATELAALEAAILTLSRDERRTFHVAVLRRLLEDPDCNDRARLEDDLCRLEREDELLERHDRGESGDLSREEGWDLQHLLCERKKWEENRVATAEPFLPAAFSPRVGVGCCGVTG